MTDYNGVSETSNHILSQERIVKSLFDILFKNVPVGVLVCARNGKIELINEFGVKLLGSPSEEATRAINLLSFQPLKQAGLSKDLITCIERNVTISNEMRYVTKWGKETFFKYQLIPFSLPSGNGLNVLGIFYDIRPEIESEMKLILYREIVMSSKDAVGIINLDGFYVEQNKAHEELIGYSIGELKKHTPSIHLGKDTFNEILDLLQKNGYYYGEVESITKEGNKLIIDMSATVIKDYDGKPEFYVAIKRDVTEKRMIERQLKKSKSILAEAQRIARIGSWEWDIVSNKEEWSDEVYRLFGLTKDESPKTYRTFLKCVHPDDRNAVEIAVQEALNGNDYSLDHRILRPDGKVIFVHEEGEVFFDDTGQPVRMIGTVHDITDRTLAEEALYESQERYRLTFEHASDVILSIDSDMVIETISPSVKTLLGYSPEEITGNDFNDLDVIAPEYIKQAREDFVKLFSGATVPTITYEFLKKDGQRIFGAINSSLVVSDGKKKGILVIRNVTESILSRKTAESAKETALLYLDILSHDISNQLQAIMNGLALLQLDIENPVELEKIKIITQAAENCSQIVSKVRVTRDLMTEPLSSQDLISSLEDSIDRYRNTFLDVNIFFKNEVSSALIMADRYLTVMIDTLLDNAIKHNPRSDRFVWIVLEELNDFYTLSISDNGTGLTDKEKTELFTLSRRFGGVGLHQTKQIATKYNGGISVHDRIPGKPHEGTCFMVILPKMN